MKRKMLTWLIAIIAIFTGIILILLIIKNSESKLESYEINLLDLNYKNNGETNKIKVYSQNEYDDFLNDYNNKELSNIYITEFLFDGVGMYKTYDLDDFVEKGNDLELDPYKVTVLNIIKEGNYELSGELTGMLAVNSNDISGNINIILNNLNIDTDSKKVPAIYVYNKDINYTKYKVTINPKEGTKNTIEGGKLKKVSLIPSDSLSDYTNKYNNTNKTNYETYTNYYGVYTAKEINNILFAKNDADNEDLQDGDPVYYYKASGAISSDIDLTFEGKGYLSVTSKNKEGIETKGNLSFIGGKGDYVISSQDDCLNTTTDGNNYRNTLTIDVNSLTAIVSLDADEGDAIDSNGELYINGGTIIAISKPGQDAGLDSSKGTYINGGTVIATGDMYDAISSDSKQTFISLNFGTKIENDTLIAMLDDNENLVFGYKTDRSYSSLVYSSPELLNGTYTLYKNGTIVGSEETGLYNKINSYSKGEQLAYSNKGQNGESFGPGMDGNMPQMPNGGDGTNPPGKPDGNMPQMPNGGDGTNPQEGQPNMMQGNTTAENSSFIIEGIANIFNGVATYNKN